MISYTSQTFLIEADIFNSSTKRTVFAVYGLVLAFMIVPFWVVQMPPLTDYPCHFARFYLLLHWKDDPALQRYYVVDWAALPNLATDVLAVGFGHFLPLEVVGRLLLSLSSAIWLCGTAFLHRILFGRYSYWPLLATPFLFNQSLTLGSLNYYFGSGLLLLVLGLAVVVRNRSYLLQLATLLSSAGVLYFSHLIVLLIFAVAIAVFEIELRLSLRSRLRDWIKSASIVALSIVPWLALLLLFAPPVYLAHSSAGGELRWGGLVDRGTMLRSAVFADLGTADVLLLGGVLIVALVFGCTRAVRLDSRFRLLLLVLGLTAVLIPIHIGQEGNLHYRLPALIACLAVASTQPLRERVSRVAICAVSILIILTATRHLVLMEAWKERDRDIAEFRRSLNSLPVGSRVLPVLALVKKGPFRSPSDGLFAYSHLAELAVSERAAYSAGFFAVRGQQPVHVAPEIAATKTLAGEPKTVEELENSAPAGWRMRYDYVIVLGDVPNRVLPFTHPALVHGRRFAIYPTIGVEHGASGDGPEIHPLIDNGFHD